jgi:hypothetical protein
MQTEEFASCAFPMSSKIHPFLRPDFHYSDFLETKLETSRVEVLRVYPYPAGFTRPRPRNPRVRGRGRVSNFYGSGRVKACTGTGRPGFLPVYFFSHF